MLGERRDQMDTMARVLLERETVEGAAVDALLDGRWDEFAAAEPAAAEPAGAAPAEPAAAE